MTRRVLTTRIVALVALTTSGFGALTALAQTTSVEATTTEDTTTEATTTALPPLTRTIAGEPLSYPNTPDPIVSSDVVTIPPGGVTEWMTHPVPAYLYVLEGALTVELTDGTRHEFHAGHSFLQSRATWHRGRNEGETPMRFLAIFIGAKDVPDVLHPPSGPLVKK
jgi:quercetin dioxygenase-like cupin family protein